MNYEQWFKKYKPIKNHVLDYPAPFEGYMFETMGEELSHVNKQPISCIWTLLEADGELFIESGSHFVNRLGYFITSKPWTDFIQIKI